MGKKSILDNFTWKLAERLSTQIVTLIVTVILARILEPKDYGTISIVTIFITLANVFVSDGFGSALIQKKNADTLDFSSVLWFNIAFSIVLYGVIFFSAPMIANFYGTEYTNLTSIFRVLGLRIILSAVNSVQQSYVSKHMIFYKLFLANIGGTVISAIVGIWMAYNDYGVWALVWQYLVNETISTVILRYSVKMKVVCRVSFHRLKEMIGFGGRILGSNLLITGFVELRALIIGKIYSPTDLAYFDKGKQFPNLIVTNINTSIGAVLFPRLVNEQDDRNRIKIITRQSIRCSAFVMCPMILGFSAIAESFVKVVLTEKWLSVVPLLQIFCIFYLFQPIHTANLQAIKAIGRGDVFLKLEVIKKTIEVLVLLITMQISVEAIAVGMAILTTVFTFVNAFPNIKLLGYSFKEQMADIMPVVAISTVMAGIVYVAGFLPIAPLWNMLLQICVGSLVYICLAVMTKNKEFYLIIELLNKRIKKRVNNEE